MLFKPFPNASNREVNAIIQYMIDLKTQLSIHPIFLLRVDDQYLTEYHIVKQSQSRHLVTVVRLRSSI